MNSETIVAVFDTPAHAQLAIADLEAAGVPSSSIQHYAHETYDATQSSTGSHSTGFWAWLIGEDSTEHHDLYNKSLTSGSTVVTVITDGADNDRIISILEQHAPVDLEERGSQYGLTSGAATGTTYGATTAATTGATSSATTARPLQRRMPTRPRRRPARRKRARGSARKSSRSPKRH